MEQYAIYLRKSRFDRDYGEMSVEETLKRHGAILEKLARDRGYSVAKVYREVVSGESIAERPQIQRLLEEVNEGRYFGVLVVDVERLARGNSADQAYISQVFQFSGTRIITPLKVYDPANEFDEEYFEFGLFMSRREYKTIARRLARGRDSSAAEGKYLGSVAPYGYRRVKLNGEKGYTLAPEPREAENVKRIYQLFLRRMGTKKIAADLNDRGVPARKGALWTSATVAHILDNPVYIGKIRRGYCRTVKSVKGGKIEKHIKRLTDPDQYALYDGLQTALITPEDYYAVQRLRREKRPDVKVKEAFELKNAFAGLIFCAACGKRVARTTLSRAQGGRARMRCVNMRLCHNASADYELVEKEIITALEAWLSGYRVRLEDPEALREEQERARADLSKWEKEEKKLQTQLDSAYDLLEQGAYSLALFKERQEKITAQVERAKEGAENAKALLIRLEKSQQKQDSMIPATQTLLESYGQLTTEEKNALLKLILRRIEYWRGPDGKIEIDLYPILPSL